MKIHNENNAAPDKNKQSMATVLLVAYFKFEREGTSRLRSSGAPLVLVDKKLEGVSVASEETGFGPGRESLVLVETNLSITAN